MATVTTLVQIEAPAGRLETLTSMNAVRAVPRLINYLVGFASGVRSRTVNTVRVGMSAVKAAGTLTMASSTGTVGGSINGVSITVTWATSDTASAAALATAINASANALVSGIVTATSALGVVTITAVEYGKTGNAITLTASGTNVTASGARLTGGVAPGFVTLGRN